MKEGKEEEEKVVKEKEKEENRKKKAENKIEKCLIRQRERIDDGIYYGLHVFQRYHPHATFSRFVQPDTSFFA